MSDQTIDDYTENDTLPAFPCTYDGVPVTDFSTLALHIKYKPYPLIIDATLDVDDDESFSFGFRSRVSGELAADASAGDTSIAVTITGDGQVFADLPASGELLIGTEHVLYTSKTGPSTITLASALTADHAVGDAFEKLPDLRAGTWRVEVETVDASGGRLTFRDLNFKIEDEIA